MPNENACGNGNLLGNGSIKSLQYTRVHSCMNRCLFAWKKGVATKLSPYFYALNHFDQIIFFRFFINVEKTIQNAAIALGCFAQFPFCLLKLNRKFKLSWQHTASRDYFISNFPEKGEYKFFSELQKKPWTNWINFWQGVCVCVHCALARRYSDHFIFEEGRWNFQEYK